MAITVDSFYVLRNYLTQLVGKTNYNTSEVNEIVLAVIGGIIWRSTDELEVKHQAGVPVNILCMTVASKKFCFVYNHNTKEIELRDSNMEGKVLTIFTNKTSIADVKSVFKNL